MMSKLLLSAVLVLCTLGTEVTPTNDALAKEVPDHDEVTLLQTQIEAKKGEAKAKTLLDDDEAVEPIYAKAACSSESCEAINTPSGEPVKADVPTQTAETKAAETVSKDQTEETSSKLTLGTALQALALLLIGDVLRRCPWKTKTPAKAAAQSPKASAKADPATALLAAALNGDRSAFEAQIDSNLSQLSKVDSWGCSILHYAAKGGSAPIVQRLVDLGAMVDALDAWDETPLHLAARAGRGEVCEILLAAGASLESTNAEECTPLIVAGRADHEAVCRLLVGHGANTAGLADSMVPELVAGILKEQESLVA